MGIVILKGLAMSLTPFVVIRTVFFFSNEEIHMSRVDAMYSPFSP